MIRIAFLIVDLEIGGTERVLERLVRGLGPDFDPCVISLVGHGPIAEPLRPRARVFELDMRHALDATVVPKTLAVLREFRPRILHTFLFHANLLGRLVGGSAKSICSIRTLEGKPYYFPVERHTWRGFDRVVCAGETVAREARKRMGLRDPLVIPNGVALPTNAVGIKGELGVAPLVASAGRLAPGKGGEVFLHLARRFPGVHFVWIGGGPQEEVLRRAALPNLHVTGWRPDVGALLVDVDLFVHASSLGEGFPNVVAEAMAAGCAVVATDVGGTRDVLGEAGRLVREGLERAVEELLGDPAERARLGDLARKRCASQFSLRTMIERYEALYRELVS